jgi:hypothetical protein
MWVKQMVPRVLKKMLMILETIEMDGTFPERKNH